MRRQQEKLTRRVFFRHVVITGGTWRKEGEHEYYRDVIEVIKKATGHRKDTLYGYLQTSPSEDESRIEAIMFILEIWDDMLFSWICPGKTKFKGGKENWVKALLKAREYWDEGKVRSNFVAGAELAKPYGLKSIEEALESSQEGFQYLMTKGVTPTYSHWTLVPDSIFGQEKQELPPTEYYIRLGKIWFDLMKRYGLRPPTCRCYRCNANTCYSDFFYLL